MSDKFDFLRKKQEQEVDWEKVKSEWIEEINLFYKQIEKWIREPFEEGLLKISYRNWDIIEENLGQYTVKNLTVLSDDKSIDFIPVARLIIGAKGRINIRSYKGEVMVVKSSTEDHWLLVTDKPRRSFEKLTEELFLDLLKWAFT